MKKNVSKSSLQSTCFGKTKTNCNFKKGKLSDINIRSTTDPDFWGTKYPHSYFLWNGAQHNLDLNQILTQKVPIVSDLFDTEQKIKKAHHFCQHIHLKLLPLLSDKLNLINRTNFPVSFWRTVFGRWLFRHICICYEKFSYLEGIEIDQTSIILLDKKSYNCPINHIDYIYCFGNDFGVHQLVSLYYELYKNKDFSYLEKDFTLLRDKQANNNLIMQMRKEGNAFLYAWQKKIKNYYKNLTSPPINPLIALCRVTYTREVLKSLNKKSNGNIQLITIPKIKTKFKKLNSYKRKQLLDIKTDTKFEHYLIQSLYHCTPKILIEYFSRYHKKYKNDLKKRAFTHIVSESWISDMPASLYIAYSQYLERRFIVFEHTVGHSLCSFNLNWIGCSTADTFLTTGWKSKHNSRIVPGGFATRSLKTYIFDQQKKDILFISRTKFNYLVEFAQYNSANSSFIKELKRVADFFENLPSDLKKHLIFRPRKEPYLWDTERTLKPFLSNIRIDERSFSDLIQNARIIIIDHTTTGLAEILLNRIPFLLLHNEKLISIAKEYQPLIKELHKCKIAHSSVKSAINHLNKIYPNTKNWWMSKSIQTAINNLIKETLGPPEKAVDYLLSLPRD